MAVTPVWATSRKARVPIRFPHQGTPALESRVIQNGTGMPGAEINAPGYRVPVFRAAATEARVEAEGTTGQIQGRPESQSAHEPLKLFGPIGLPALEPVVRHERRHGGE